MSFKIYMIALLTFALLSTFGCTKVFYKEFILRGSAMKRNNCIEFSRFELSIFIIAGSNQRKRIESDDYSIFAYLRVTDSSYASASSFYKAFTLDSLRITDVSTNLIQIISDTIPDTASLSTSIGRETGDWEYGKYEIPAYADTIILNVFYSIDNHGEIFSYDTTGIKMWKDDGHYKVPLGFLLD